MCVECDGRRKKVTDNGEEDGEERQQGEQEDER